MVKTLIGTKEVRGISDMLLDNDPIYWRTKVKEQLEMDGQSIKMVKG